MAEAGRQRNPLDRAVGSALGLRLRQARERAGITREEVAARMGVTYQAVQRLEAGAGSPRLVTVLRYSAALDLDAIQLIRTSMHDARETLRHERCTA